MKFLGTIIPIAAFVALAACAPVLQQGGNSNPAAPAPNAAIPPAGRIIQVTTEFWKFTPNIITAKQGERVTLQVTGISGTHGFSVPALGINQPIFPGQTVAIPLPTDTAGTFDLACSIQCGSGHNDMKGQIIIE